MKKCENWYSSLVIWVSKVDLSLPGPVAACSSELSSCLLYGLWIADPVLLQRLWFSSREHWILISCELSVEAWPVPFQCYCPQVKSEQLLGWGRQAWCQQSRYSCGPVAQQIVLLGCVRENWGRYSRHITVLSILHSYLLVRALDMLAVPTLGCGSSGGLIRARKHSSA